MTARFVILLSLVLAAPALSQPNPDTLWTRTYDLGGAESGYAVAPVPQGGYVVVGQTWGMDPSHTLFLRVDSDGYVIEQRTIVVAGEMDAAKDMYSLPDGSRYILCGWVSTGEPGYDSYIMKTDLDGAPEWTQTFGEYNNDESVFSICPADDGGFLLTGWTAPVGSSDWVGYLAKVNSEGIFQWSRNYGDIGIVFFSRIISVANDTYILAGSQGLYPEDDACLVKIDGVGDTLWTRSYGGPLGQYARDVALLPDGGFAVVGETESANHEMYLIRTDANGDTLWTRAIGSTSHSSASAVAPGPAGNLVIVGCTSVGWRDEDLHLIGVDALGNEIWRRTWNNTINNYADRVLATADGGYLILGNKIPGNNNDVYLIKTGPDQGADAGEPPPAVPDQLTVEIYPNPFNSVTRIVFGLPQASEVAMNLYNLMGQCVAGLARGRYQPGEHAVLLQGGDLTSGVYYVHTVAGSFRQVNKVVLMK